MKKFYILLILIGISALSFADANITYSFKPITFDLDKNTLFQKISVNNPNAFTVEVTPQILSTGDENAVKGLLIFPTKQSIAPKQSAEFKFYLKDSSYEAGQFSSFLTFDTKEVGQQIHTTGQLINGVRVTIKGIVPINVYKGPYSFSIVEASPFEVIKSENTYYLTGKVVNQGNVDAKLLFDYAYNSTQGWVQKSSTVTLSKGGQYILNIPLEISSGEKVNVKLYQISYVKNQPSLGFSNSSKLIISKTITY